MQEITIYTHRPGRAYLGPHFFILSKGKNSGRPMFAPCANCFVIQFENWADFKIFYWLAYSLFISRFWRYYLVGSVILFLRLFEFKKEYEKQIAKILAEQEIYMKRIDVFMALEHKEADCRKKLGHIQEMRRAVLHTFFQPKTVTP